MKPEGLVLFHRLHGLAERSGREEETSAYLGAWLEERGIKVRPITGTHGFLVTLGPPPYRLLRAELDGLPAPGGARHGCGHDGHMAMLAEALAGLAADPPGHGVAALFQPAEEDGSGMRLCMEGGLADLAVRDCFAIHNVPGAPFGTLLVGPGAVASTGIRIGFAGRESHAAHPEEGCSPWPAIRDLADAVEDLATGHGGLATLIHVGLGEPAYGTSPGRGSVSVTLRGPEDAVTTMKAGLVARAEGLARGAGLGLVTEEVDPFPETRNDTGAQDLARKAAEVAGVPCTHLHDPFAWSEDFGHATHRWPGALLGLGSGVDQAPLHDDAYVFPEALLPMGVRFWTALARGPA